MNDDQIEVAILDALKAVNSPRLWNALTSERGPYDINVPTYDAIRFVRALPVLTAPYAGPPADPELVQSLRRTGLTRSEAVGAARGLASLQATPPAAPAAVQEPVAYMWQHDETGRIGFVDPWQIENGWREANPRLQIVAPLYRTPPAAPSDEGRWISVEERMPEPGTECVVLLRYVEDRPPHLGLDRWEMQREDPTGMGGPTVDMGYSWSDNFESDVLAWTPIPKPPAALAAQPADRDPLES